MMSKCMIKPYFKIPLQVILSTLELQKQQGLGFFFRPFDLILVLTSSVLSRVVEIGMSSALIILKSIYTYYM